MRERSRVSSWIAAVLAFAACSLAAAQLPGVPAVQTGLRATFYASSASIRGVLQQAVFKPDCDPTVEDCWVDPETGKSIGQVDVPSPAGQGYTVFDVLYLDDQVCVFRATSYVLDYTTGSVTTAGGAGDVTTGGTCSDYWMDPRALSQLEVGQHEGVRILKGPSTAGGVTVDAVSIATTTSGGATHTSYDTGTGLLFVASSRTRGGAVPTISPDNTVVPGAGSNMLTYTQILGARLVPGVGTTGPLPAHVQNTSRLVYRCSYAMAMPGAGAVETPCTLEVRVDRRTEMWATVSTELHMADPLTGGVYATPEAGNVLVGSGHGGYFASPTLLSGLQQGTTLDIDPITGIRTTVAFVDASTVAIVEESNAELNTFVYDRTSGWLLRLVTEKFLQMATDTTRFELVSVE